jgi:hypothetical protein
MSLLGLSMYSMQVCCVAMTLLGFVWNHFLAFRRATNVPAAKTTWCRMKFVFPCHDMRNITTEKNK